MPNHYRTTVSGVSDYAKASFEELYAELKTKSILTPNDMSKSEWELLKYIEKY